MKKYFHFLIIKLFEKLSDWNIKLWEQVVTHYYQSVRKKKQFILETKEIRVKKGKRRYTLVVCETKEGKIRFNLGRHLTVETLRHLLNPA